MIRTRAASDRTNSAHAVALEAIRRISSEVPEILVGDGTSISPDQAWQADQAGAQLVSRHPPNIVGRQP
jgi:2-keto-3-deoxy-6-phosphogluconate aldolase